MKRCIIISAGELGRLTRQEIAPAPGDYIIACDAGILHAQALGITPDLIVGDFDSYDGPLPEGIPVLRVGEEKDDTDTMLAVRLGLQEGCGHFLLVAATGGVRLDHTIANLQTLCFLQEHGVTGEILGARERAWLLRNGSLTIPNRPDCTLSVFAFGADARGVTLRGVHYPLERATLTCGFPIGVSNHIEGPAATVTVEQGTVLILQCRLSQ